MRLDEIFALPKYGTRHRPKSVEEVAGADEKQVVAMRWYQDGGYRDINGALRGKEREHDLTDEEMLQWYGGSMRSDEAIQHLDTVIANQPRRRSTIITYRGERNVARARKLLAMDLGDSYKESGFLSTSFDPTHAYYAFSQTAANGSQAENSNSISMYRIKPDVPGIYMKLPDEDAVEKEFVLARGCDFTLLEKRTIPVRNPGYREKELQLLVWGVRRAYS